MNHHGGDFVRPGRRRPWPLRVRSRGQCRVVLRLLPAKRGGCRRFSGHRRAQQLIEGVRRRFWPVVMTSLASFAGFAPLILEGVVQAPFVIPFSASLEVAIIVTTGTLILPISAKPLLCRLGMDLLVRSAPLPELFLEVADLALEFARSAGQQQHVSDVERPSDAEGGPKPFEIGFQTVDSFVCQASDCTSRLSASVLRRRASSLRL